ncbi:SDR family NAD(P)-dependent oxidoreductase [Denitromonas ohlonensis]|uniref:SDR family oxidoreductase n=2 Tax=Denitromonas TaxID=139331 RepID=A0A557RNZ4_9RHOO|nr:SDR family NAD(P)-dependent oxidoreductase [Denitromonas ohlonensis]TVO66889.1 SDR family oxidoreductase [Denitromonas ohlonensis]TVO79759.1 SDR family oxidoreductase [Denitromonas ohlonensis]
MPQHSSRIALITGAASGIGRSVAERLALQDGAMVCIVDREADAAREAAHSIEAAGGRAQTFVADLADSAAVQRMLNRIDAEIGMPDIVINNAGIAATIPVLDYPLSHWQLTMAVNVTAPMLIIQHVLRGMKARGWGRVVNVASISGVRAGTGRLGYGTSKAALLALTRQFAVEAAEWGVTVNAVAPGPIETPMVKQMHGGSSTDIYRDMMPMRRYGAVADIAHAIAFLASENSGFITGETLAVDGGFLASGLLVRDLFAATPLAVAAHS